MQGLDYRSSHSVGSKKVIEDNIQDTLTSSWSTLYEGSGCRCSHLPLINLTYMIQPLQYLYNTLFADDIDIFTNKLLEMLSWSKVCSMSLEKEKELLLLLGSLLGNILLVKRRLLVRSPMHMLLQHIWHRRFLLPELRQSCYDCCKTRGQDWVVRVSHVIDGVALSQVAAGVSTRRG